MKRLILCLLLIAVFAAARAQDDPEAIASQGHRLFAANSFAEAEKLYTRALEAEKAGGETFLSRTSRFDILQRLVECKKKDGRYSECRDVLKELKPVARSLGRVRYEAYWFNYIDYCLYAGDYAEAFSALDSIRSGDQQVRKSIFKSDILYRQGDYDGALHILNNLLQTTSATDPLYSVILQNKAYINWQIPAYLPSAIDDMTEALRCSKTDTDSYHVMLSNLSLMLARNGKGEEAREGMAKAEQWFAKPGKSSAELTIILRKRAEMNLLLGNVSEAYKAFSDYFKKEKLYVTANFASMTEQKRLDFWKKEKPLMSEIFALEDEAADFLLDVSLVRRELALLGSADSVLIKQRLELTGKDVRNKLGMNDVAIDFVRYEKESGGMKVPMYGAIIVSSAKSNRKTRFVPLWKESEVNNFIVGNGKPLINNIQSNLPDDKNIAYDDESLGEFIWSALMPHISAASSVYFVPDGIIQLLAIENLNHQVARDGRIRLHRLSSLARLCDREVKPSAVANAGNMLVIGGLNYDKVPDEQPSATSSHEAMEYLKRAFHPKQFWFKYLEGTKHEADSIAKLFKKAELLSVVSEEKARKLFPKYSTLHFSSHAYSVNVDVQTSQESLRDSVTEDKSLLASGLVLSGANVLGNELNRDDGLFSARELCDMNLKNMQLAVISACQSAEGTISDEGPAGILRALKKAGVKTIIATLWPVSDKATSVFMTAFYTSYSQSGNIHEAFNAAKKFLREEYAVERTENISFNKSKKTASKTTGSTVVKRVMCYKRPAYWAPFILVDNF